MILGIEIGGTKLQIGVGRGDKAKIEELVRAEIDRDAGAKGILRQVEEITKSLMKRHRIDRIGIGFGGPVCAERGLVLTSHQIDGWKNFPLADWCRDTFGIETYVANDCELAALAESLYGASVGANPSIYVTVGTGVGCGVVIDGDVYRGRGHGAAEIGHLKPMISGAATPQPMEMTCSGPGIAASVKSTLDRHLSSKHASDPDKDLVDLLNRCQGNLEQLTCKVTAEAANAGNLYAIQAYRDATNTIGWGIAQVATLFAPEIVVVGGGVSLAGEEIFFKPLSQAIDRYLTPTFRGAFEVKPSELGEEIVIYGALTLASIASDQLFAF